MKLGVAMIVKNEEQLLGRCLDSLEGIDEIVILDTGSTDNTRDVAKRYTDKYYEGIYTWNDNFAEARNKARSLSTADWILHIDADEWLEEGGMAKVRKAISDNPNVKAINLIAEGSPGGTRYIKPRLSRNIPEVFMKGAVHNHLNVLGEASCDAVIYFGYSPAHKNDPDRAIRILTSELEKNPNLPRERFYLGREWIYRRQWDKAIEEFQKFLKVGRWNPEVSDAQFNIAYCYKQMGKWQEARNHCIKAIGINPDFKKALRLMADLSWPDNKAKWNRIADAAQNKDVLFT